MHSITEYIHIVLCSLVLLQLQCDVAWGVWQEGRGIQDTR